MINQVTIEILKEFGPHKLGANIRVPCDVNSIPLSAYWRSRLRDAEIDFCCIIKQKLELLSQVSATKKEKLFTAKASPDASVKIGAKEIRASKLKK